MVPQGGRQTQAACIRDIGSTQNCSLLAKRQTTQRKHQRGTWYGYRRIPASPTTILMFFGHVVRMDERRLPYILLYGRLQVTRPRGRQNKRWFDNIRDDCAEMEMTITSAATLARDRSRWNIAVGRLLERTDPSMST